MAKILIASIGTRGDVQPLSALAAGLSLTGHSVTMATDEYHFQGDASFAWKTIRSLDKHETVDAMQKASLKKDPTFRGNFLGACIGKAFRQNTPDFLKICLDYDLIILNILALIGFPELRTQMHGPLKSFAFYFPLEMELAKVCRSPNFLNLLAISKSIATEMAYYKNIGYEMTGFWLPKQRQKKFLSEKIREFLDAGPPPLLVTLGSMATVDSQKYSTLILNALKKTRQRAIVQKGWGSFFENAESIDQILLVNEIDHDALLPFVSTVIHHGGCGTTATVAKAGKVSIIMPQLADQSNWAALLRQKGVSAGTIYPWDISESNLTEMIIDSVDNQILKLSAADLANSLQTEDGVSVACEIINRELIEKDSLPISGKQTPALRQQRNIESTGIRYP